MWRQSICVFTCQSGGKLLVSFWLIKELFTLFERVRRLLAVAPVCLCSRVPPVCRLSPWPQQRAQFDANMLCFSPCPCLCFHTSPLPRCTVRLQHFRIYLQFAQWRQTFGGIETCDKSAWSEYQPTLSQYVNTYPTERAFSPQPHCVTPRCSFSWNWNRRSHCICCTSLQHGVKLINF